MKVSVTFDFDDHQREALAVHNGQQGKATHQELLELIVASVQSTIEEIVWDYEERPGAEDTQ